MKTTGNQSVKIIPLGGLEQIGMNITAFEYEDSIIVVDCGLAFPDDEMLGIDLVIPDITYLKENASKVKGLVITHGHEDHIGAIPYALKELNMPIYATKLTMGLIENKLKEHNLLRTTRRKVIKHGLLFFGLVFPQGIFYALAAYLLWIVVREPVRGNEQSRILSMILLTALGIAAETLINPEVSAGVFRFFS